MKRTLFTSTILSLGLAFPALAGPHPVTGEELSANQEIGRAHV